MEISNTSNVLDVREIIERVEELEKMGSADDADAADEVAEFRKLNELLGELGGNGGDHEWRGEWYPITLVHESYFEDYARELAEDIGAIPDDAKWPCTCIDWEKAAEELKNGYTSVEFDGETFLYR